MPPQALPFILLLGVFFGTTLLASRFSVGQFESTTFISLRLLLASAAHVLVYLFAGKKRPWPAGRTLWLRSSVMAVFATAIPMNLIVASLEFQSSGVTSMLITINPAITVVLAHFFLEDERLTFRKIIGVGIALSGAFLLLLLGETGLEDVSGGNLIGYLMVFIAMLSSGSATIYARKYMQECDSFDVASVRMWVAALIVLPISLLIDGFDLSRVDRVGAAALGWAALAGTFFGMLLSFYNIKRFGATASAMTAYILPVVASIGGVLLLDEKITWGMAGGMVLIITGIAIINQRRSVVVQA